MLVWCMLCITDSKGRPLLSDWITMELYFCYSNRYTMSSEPES